MESNLTGKLEKAEVNSISAWGTPSNKIYRYNLMITKVLFGFVILLLFKIFFAGYLYGIIIDRLVAYVDDTAITLSELEYEFGKVSKATTQMSKKEILNSMINRILLLKEARKIRLEAQTDDELINAYVDIKIKSRIFVREEDISDFYKKHHQEFKGQDELLVRDEIEKYLLEKEFNDILRQHLRELWQLSDIKILFTDK
jgi:hypothetical protein